MQRSIRYTLGSLVLVAVAFSTVPRTAAAQGAKPDACKYMDAAQMLKLTGRKDILRKGPQTQDPSEIPNNTAGCHFLGVLLVLDTPFAPDRFARARAATEKSPTFKLQSVSGIGDEAYLTWDPRPGTTRSIRLIFRSGNTRIGMEDLVPADSIETVKKWLIEFGKTAASRAK